MGTHETKYQEPEVLVKPQESPKPEFPDLYVIDIKVLGNSKVGKSSIVSRLSRNMFSMAYSPNVALDRCTVLLDFGPFKTRLEVCDTVYEPFTVHKAARFRRTQGVLVLFDLTNYSTWSSVPRWIEEVGNYNTNKIATIIVGNKEDLDTREVTAEEIQLQEFEHYSETSCKHNRNVIRTFSRLALSCVESVQTEKYGGTSWRKHEEEVLLAHAESKWRQIFGDPQIILFLKHADKITHFEGLPPEVRDLIVEHYVNSFK